MTLAKDNNNNNSKKPQERIRKRTIIKEPTGGRTAIGWAGVVLMVLTAVITAFLLIAAIAVNAPVGIVIVGLIISLIFFVVAGLMMRAGKQKREVSYEIVEDMPEDTRIEGEDKDTKKP